MAMATFSRWTLYAVATLVFVHSAAAFQSSRSRRPARRIAGVVQLNMANNDDFMRWAKQSRSAGADDNLVALMRPLGLVLNEDEQGNVYVETVAPKGNAARTGRVRAVHGDSRRRELVSRAC